MIDGETTEALSGILPLMQGSVLFRATSRSLLQALRFLSFIRDGENTLYIIDA